MRTPVLRALGPPVRYGRSISNFSSTDGPALASSAGRSGRGPSTATRDVQQVLPLERLSRTWCLPGASLRRRPGRAESLGTPAPVAGLYGGGQGGEGGNSGGGGGSNLVPAGGSFVGTAKAGEEGSVTITYTPLPTSKDQCKDGGWKSYGSTFKNQGQCVSFVETGKRA